MNRRAFLLGMGATAASAVVVPYVPERIYSFMSGPTLLVDASLEWRALAYSLMDVKHTNELRQYLHDVFPEEIYEFRRRRLTRNESSNR